MLNTLTQKLSPLMSLIFITAGCGKNFIDSNAKEAELIQNQELPSMYVLLLDGSVSSRKNYPMPMSAQFEIPRQLKVKKGTTQGKVVEVVFDVNEFDSDDYQFKCSYVASFNSGELVLNKCVDFYGYDFGDVSQHKFTLHFKDIIQIKFTGASAQDLAVDAIFSMNWI